VTPKLLTNELKKHIEPKLVKELIFEFEKAKTSHWLGDITTTLMNAAKFCEVCIACIKNVSNKTVKIDMNKIQFGKFYDNILGLPKNSPKEEMLYLVIPNVLKSIYSVRSKKRVAHIKMTNADSIDAEMTITSCNWVMCQLIMIYNINSIEEAIELTNSIMERKVPTIEEFADGELMILKRGMKFSDELLLILYQFAKRMTTKELNLLLKPKKSSYISTYLNGLYNKKLIHLNKEGAIINKNGIKEIEENKEKYFN